MATLTSTTDTRENMAAALRPGDEWKTPPSQPEETPATIGSESVPLDQLPPKKFNEVRDQQEREKKADGPEFLQDPERERILAAKRGTQPRTQRTIDKLTRKWRTEEARANALEARLNGTLPAVAQTAPEPISEAQPKEQNTAAPKIRASDAEAAKVFPDYRQAIQAADRAGIEISPALAHAIEHAQNFEAVRYTLAKNPALIRELEKDPANGIARLSRDLQGIQENFSRSASEESARQKLLFESHLRRVTEALKAEPDAAKLIAGHNPITPNVALAILEQENSERVALHLARNPDLLAELNRLPASAAMSRVGRIAENLEAKAKAARPRVSPPEPIEPLGGSSAVTSLPLDQLPQREFNRIRNAQEAAWRRGR